MLSDKFVHFQTLFGIQACFWIFRSQSSVLRRTLRSDRQTHRKAARRLCRAVELYNLSPRMERATAESAAQTRRISFQKKTSRRPGFRARIPSRIPTRYDKVKYRKTVLPLFSNTVSYSFFDFQIRHSFSFKQWHFSGVASKRIRLQ